MCKGYFFLSFYFFSHWSTDWNLFRCIFWQVCHVFPNLIIFITTQNFTNTFEYVGIPLFMLKGSFERKGHVPWVSFYQDRFSVFRLDLFYRNDLVDRDNDLLSWYLEPIWKEKNLSFGPRRIKPSFLDQLSTITCRWIETWNRRLLSKFPGLKYLEFPSLEGYQCRYLRSEPCQLRFELKDQKQSLFLVQGVLTKNYKKTLSFWNQI